MTNSTETNACEQNLQEESEFYTLPKKCPYLELFRSAFSRIRTECGEILHISPHSVGMRENTDQNNSEYEHFLRSHTT